MTPRFHTRGVSRRPLRSSQGTLIPNESRLRATSEKYPQLFLRHCSEQYGRFPCQRLLAWMAAVAILPSPPYGVSDAGSTAFGAANAADGRICPIFGVFANTVRST